MNIFLRQREPHIDLPVAIVTDSDIRPYSKEETEEGLDFMDKFSPTDIATYEAQTTEKIATLTAKNEQSVRYFVSNSWTLEYSLANSEAFGELFKQVTKAIHTRTDWSNFNAKLAEKLLRKSLNKTEIAYKIASILDTKHRNTTPIPISEPIATDRAKYIIDAIKYAARV